MASHRITLITAHRVLTLLLLLSESCLAPSRPFCGGSNNMFLLAITYLHTILVYRI
jgi:hypothetical protein